MPSVGAKSQELLDSALRNGLIANPLQVLRESRRMNRSQLAKLVGCTPTFLCQVEHNERVPGEDLAKRIARVFNVSTKALRSELVRCYESNIDRQIKQTAGKQDKPHIVNRKNKV